MSLSVAIIITCISNDLVLLASHVGIFFWMCVFFQCVIKVSPVCRKGSAIAWVFMDSFVHSYVIVDVQKNI